MIFDSKSYNRGRIGKLHMRQASFDTPLLFPVVALVTGTTPRGGGLWKYVLQADKENGLLRRNLPVMSQVLHFLDFTSNHKGILRNWQNSTILDRYNQDEQLDLHTTSPLFLDSGGYQLLTNSNIDLTEYGLKFDEHTGQKTVLDLQKGFGGDVVATLDYPLPPNLVRSEAEARMCRSRTNALIAAKQIASTPSDKPVFFVAAHGQDGDDIEKYGREIYQQFDQARLNNLEFGFAIGSLVPLRGSSKIAQIVEQIQGLQRSIPEEKRATTPIHTFGMTGNLIPILAYLGVDTFDSSAYAQEARALSYMNPQTRRFSPVLEMNDLECECRVCNSLNFGNLHHALTSKLKNKPQECGHFKSKYYGDIALHNLEMDYKLVEQVRQAIAQDALLDFVVEHSQKFNDASKALTAIAQDDEELKKKLTTVSFLIPKRAEKEAPKTQTLSLEWTSEAFDISNHDYAPNPEKSALLIIPCSEEKPYSSSRSHQIVAQRLKQQLNGQFCQIHKVTLSGLYGPVPEECENDNQVLTYDFRLDPNDTIQIRLVANRLVEYIREHRTTYNVCCAYATSAAYRTALELAAETLNTDFEIHLEVLPSKPKVRRMTEFYRQSNIEELSAYLAANIPHPQVLITE